MSAKGLTTNTVYSSNDIMNNYSYSLMNKEGALIDDDGDIVFPVRSISGNKSPHFRKANNSNIERIGRSENN